MSQPPYIQRVVPCECGSTEPYWHGPEDGTREYCCDACWSARKKFEAIVDAVKPTTPAQLHLNGQPARWTPDIWAQWVRRVDPFFAPGETCSFANYFTARPYVDAYNRGSHTTGFTYTVQPGNRVAFIHWSN